MIRTTLDDAEMHLRDLIDAALRGEEVVILTVDGLGEREIQVIAMPSRTGAVQPQFGSAKGLIDVHDNFDDPLEEFGVYP
jgi:hypothetical protein